MNAISLYAQGYKLAVIAEILDISKATVSRRLKNVPNRPRVQVTAEYAQMAVQMRKDGFTWEDAAYKIGFHARTLQRAVNKYAEQGLIE
jgi:transposase